LKTWTIQEWYGCIMVWHDVVGRAPLWPLDTIEDLDDGGFLPVLPSCRIVHRIRAHPQMPLENSCDVFHVAFVHGGQAAEPVSMVFDEFCCHEELAITYGGNRKNSWLTPDGPTRSIITARMWGIGNTWLRFPDELVAGVQLTNVTPVDETYSDRRFIDLQLKVIQQDFFTWENMKVLHAPNFAVEEAKFYGALRRWCTRFYPDPAEFQIDRLEYEGNDGTYTPVAIRATEI
jgi:phenylpropionate dioxygenase-like ring-hydroxylating dioxygenase large terminal subunit